MERQRNSTGDHGELGRSEPFPPDTTIARYRLVSLIGSGAMGDVYRAHDRALDREVALKVLPSDLVADRERVQRFAQEARSASALSHPHIVTIHEVGHARPVVSVRPIGERASRPGEVHYISMELIDGHTLRETLAAPLPLRQTLELLAQVAEGLAKAHAAGILHRDLKPDNILIARDGYAKIVDFGLAKLIDTSWNPIGADSPTLRALTAHGELLGTPGYMAPEQITGQLLDARADIFSFGCILYEAVSGARAFEAETFVDTLYKILHEQPAPIPASAPAGLQEIVDKCLAKNRDNRYQTIREVAAELRAFNAQTLELPLPRRPTDLLRNAAIATVIAALPILGFIFLRRDVAPAATPEPNIRRLTSDGRALDTAISPDGRWIAYVTYDAKGRTLSIEQIATGRALALVPPTDSHYTGLSFSRDGEYLYFTRYDAGTVATLYRIPILGGDPQALVRDVDSRAAFSPDGARMVYARDDYNKGTSQLFTANAGGGDERPLASFRLPDRAFWPVWSPDGKRILIVQQSNLLEIVYPAGRTRTIETTPRFAGYRGVAWPEARRIVAAASTADAGGRVRLWSVDPDDGEAAPISSDLIELYAPVSTDDGALAALQVIQQANLFVAGMNANTQQLTSGIGAGNGLAGVTWSGDRVLYTSSADGKHDLWSMNATTRETTRLTNDESLEAKPVVTPDNATIVFLAGTSHNYTIWRMNADGRERRQLTTGPRDGDFAVSPDAKSLAFASLDPKTNEWMLWTMPLSGGEKRRLATSRSVLREIRYAEDGKSIVFTGYEKDTLRLVRVGANGGPATVLPGGRAHDASISPDGNTIACVYEDAKDPYRAPLALIPVRGGKLRTLDLEGMLYRWHPSGRAVSFLREENGHSDLWLQPLDGSEPRRLTQFNEGSIADYSWSADGARVVVAHAIESADVVLMR